MQRSKTILLLSFLAFAIAGAVSRMILVSVHSRLQIAAFCVAAVLFQFATRRLFGQSPSKVARFAFVWNAAAAALAILITRIIIEGVPDKLQSVLNSIRA